MRYRQTDQPTDQPTGDQPTDTASYRGALTCLEKGKAAYRMRINKFSCWYRNLPLPNCVVRVTLFKGQRPIELKRPSVGLFLLPLALLLLFVCCGCSCCSWKPMLLVNPSEKGRVINWSVSGQNIICIYISHLWFWFNILMINKMLFATIKSWNYTWL